jgi:hypothetical protein
MILLYCKIGFGLSLGKSGFSAFFFPQQKFTQFYTIINLTKKGFCILKKGCASLNVGVI